MAKSDLGTKRICPTTGKKFYDLNKTPVISPYTGEVVPVPVSLDPATPVTATATPTPLAVQDTDIRSGMNRTDGSRSGSFSEEEGDEDVTDIIGDVGNDEET